MSQYEDTVQFWNNIFQNEKEFDIIPKLRYPEIDEALEWLSDQEAILDFGCGNGRMLFRTLLSKQVKKVLGIDLSNEAIELANKVVKNNQLEQRATFICGGIEALKDVPSNSFDGAILSNIFDNLLPSDALTLLHEVNRIIKDGGKVIIKVNPYITVNKQAEFGFHELAQNFFKEQSGLYLYNLTNEEITTIFSNYFTIIRYVEVYFKEYDMTNRLFYLSNKKTS